eukprot:SM000152S01548  [mRNA]  locus=s152:165282:170630:- [translate_table: standard]
MDAVVPDTAAHERLTRYRAAKKLKQEKEAERARVKRQLQEDAEDRRARSMRCDGGGSGTPELQLAAASFIATAQPLQSRKGVGDSMAALRDTSERVDVLGWEGRSASAAVVAAAPPTVHLQILGPGGRKLRASFPADATLLDVRAFVLQAWGGQEGAALASSPPTESGPLGQACAAVAAGGSSPMNGRPAGAQARPVKAFTGPSACLDVDREEQRTLLRQALERHEQETARIMAEAQAMRASRQATMAHTDALSPSASNVFFLVLVPRKEYFTEEAMTTTLAEAELWPGGSLVVHIRQDGKQAGDSMQIDAAQLTSRQHAAPDPAGAGPGPSMQAIGSSRRSPRLAAGSRSDALQAMIRVQPAHQPVGPGWNEQQAADTADVPLEGAARASSQVAAAAAEARLRGSPLGQPPVQAPVGSLPLAVTPVPVPVPGAASNASSHARAAQGRAPIGRARRVGRQLTEQQREVLRERALQAAAQRAEEAEEMLRAGLPDGRPDGAEVQQSGAAQVVVAAQAVQLEPAPLRSFGPVPEVGSAREILGSLQSVFMPGEPLAMDAEVSCANDQLVGSQAHDERAQPRRGGPPGAQMRSQALAAAERRLAVPHLHAAPEALPQQISAHQVGSSLQPGSSLTTTVGEGALLHLNDSLASSVSGNGRARDAEDQQPSSTPGRSAALMQQLPQPAAARGADVNEVPRLLPRQQTGVAPCVPAPNGTLSLANNHGLGAARMHGQEAGASERTSLLKIRLEDGSVISQTFGAGTTIQMVRDSVTPNVEDPDTYDVVIPFLDPHLINGNNLELTLDEAGLVPQGAVHLRRQADRGVVTRGRRATSRSRMQRPAQQGPVEGENEMQAVNLDASTYEELMVLQERLGRVTVGVPETMISALPSRIIGWPMTHGTADRSNDVTVGCHGKPCSKLQQELPAILVRHEQSGRVHEEAPPQDLRLGDEEVGAGGVQPEPMEQLDRCLVCIGEMEGKFERVGGPPADPGRQAVKMLPVEQYH